MRLQSEKLLANTTSDYRVATSDSTENWQTDRSYLKKSKRQNTKKINTNCGQIITDIQRLPKTIVTTLTYIEDSSNNFVITCKRESYAKLRLEGGYISTKRMC